MRGADGSDQDHGGKGGQCRPGVTRWVGYGSGHGAEGVGRMGCMLSGFTAAMAAVEAELATLAPHVSNDAAQRTAGNVPVLPHP